jgi:phytoene dehydrogenase-like protein
MAKTRINHVAMSVPADTLDDTTRKELLEFYGEVFGWSEYVAPEEPGNPLIMRMAEPTQFVYVHPEPGGGMVAPRLDHFGVEVATEAELDEILERARRFAERDDRVEIIDKKVTVYGTDESAAPELAGLEVALVNCYVRYRLPLMVEVQHFRLTPKAS